MGKVILREGWPPTAQTPVNPHDVYVKQLQVINETLRQRVEKLETANILVERYRTSLKNSPVVFAHVDEELRYEWIFNPHPDFDPSAVVGKRDDELDAGPGIDALVALKQRVLERGEPEHKEITFARSDGDHTYDITATPVSDKEGRVQKIITAAIDITDRRQLQKEIITNDVARRWKIGQFLHDDLGQTLASSTIFLNNVKSEIARSDLEESIDIVLDILSESSKNVRNLSHEVVPVDIEQKDVTRAFNNLAWQLEKVYDVHCDLEYNHALDHLNNTEIATHLYRIIHEATKNATAHGNAKNVKVTLKKDNDYLYLTIEDDGTGFSDSAKEDGGMGINIMRHRIDLMGGTFEVKDTSSLGDTGAIITCKIPIQEV